MRLYEETPESYGLFCRNYGAILFQASYGVLDQRSNVVEVAVIFAWLSTVRDVPTAFPLTRSLRGRTG